MPREQRMSLQLQRAFLKSLDNKTLRRELIGIV
jgi:hypothetical protein